jgi:RimJ/RimL family protein N-acetyltransferase
MDGQQSKPLILYGRSIEDIVASLCPRLTITEARIGDSNDCNEISKLHDLWLETNRVLYLDYNNFQFAFLAKWGDQKYFVGFCTLRDYSPPSGHYSISCLTHPDLQDLHIGSALVAYAVAFAQIHPNIDLLHGITLPDSAMARIFEKLGFVIKDQYKTPAGVRVAYYLDTHQPIRLA